MFDSNQADFRHIRAHVLSNCLSSQMETILFSMDRVTDPQYTKQFIGHTGEVISVACSSDGRYLLTGSCDETAKIWGISSGECVTLTGHTGKIFSVAWSPDGTYVATGSYDKTVKIWEASTQRCIHTLSGHAGVISSLAWGPDGTSIATGSPHDPIVKIWRVSDGACMHELSGHEFGVLAVAWSPAGQYIATQPNYGAVKRWNVHDCYRCIEEKFFEPFYTSDILVWVDDEHIIVGSKSGVVYRASFTDGTKEAIEDFVDTRACLAYIDTRYTVVSAFYFSSSISDGALDRHINLVEYDRIMVLSPSGSMLFTTNGGPKVVRVYCIGQLKKDQEELVKSLSLEQVMLLNQLGQLIKTGVTVVPESLRAAFQTLPTEIQTKLAEKIRLA